MCGRTYMILGASSGIGKNIAEYLTKEKKCNVVLVARNEKKLNELAEELPGNNLAIAYDLKDLAHIDRIFETCMDRHLVLDGVVYSAGIAPLFSIEDNDPEQIMETIKINVLAFSEIGKCLLHYDCVSNNCAVVAISSIVSQTVTNRQSAYAASKAMLNTYVRFLAREGIHRLRVNAILPGAVRTELLQEMFSQSEGLEERMQKYYPLGIIPVDRISKLAAYLLSDDADHITGSLIEMDSGYSVCK